MFKILSLIAFISVPAFAQVTRPRVDLSCTLTKLYDSGVFEESLSKEEYPELEIMTAMKPACPMCPAFSEAVHSVSIGMSMYNAADGARMLKTYNSKMLRTYTITKEGLYSFEIVVNKRQTGADLYEVLKNGRRSKIAKFKCEKPEEL